MHVANPEAYPKDAEAALDKVRKFVDKWPLEGDKEAFYRELVEIGEAVFAEDYVKKEQEKWAGQQACVATLKHSQLMTQ